MKKKYLILLLFILLLCKKFRINEGILFNVNSKIFVPFIFIFGCLTNLFDKFLVPKSSQIKSLNPLPSVPNSKFNISNEFLVLFLLTNEVVAASEKINLVLKS